MSKIDVPNIIYNFVRKKLAKNANDTGGITKLPQSMDIESGMQEVFKVLKKRGLNPASASKIIKNEDDLGRIIAEAAAIDKDKKLMRDYQQEMNNTVQEIMDKMAKGIPVNPLDKKKLEASGFKVDVSKGLFKGFEPKVIEGGKDLTMKAPGGEIKYIESPTQTIIQGGKRVPVKIPKDVKDDVLESFENIMLTGEDTKYDADILSDEIARQRGLIPDDGIADSSILDIKTKVAIYDEAYSFLTKSNFLNRPPRKKTEGIEKLLEEGKITKGTAPKTTKTKPPVDPELQKSEDLKKEFQDFKDRNPDEKAMGGRIGMNRGGGIFKFLSENSPIQAYKKYLQSVKRRSQEGDFKSLAPELGAISAGGIFTNRKMKQILEEGNELQKERFLKEFIEKLDNDPSYDDRPELKDKMIEKYTESLFGEKKAMGGRIGFNKGSGMSRRTFLKLMGGLASIPFVGKLFKPAAKVAKTAEIAKQSGVPAYFPKLVEKIKLLGDDITRTNALQERQVVTKYKDYEMTENLSTGNIEIEKTNEGMGTFVNMAGDVETYDGIASKELISYSPPETIIGKNNKPVEVPAIYEETTAKSTGIDGKLEDFSEGLDSYDEILEEVGETKIKKAGGGLAYMLGE